VTDAATDARPGAGDAPDRWLYAWALGYVAVGAASLLVPLYAVALGAGPFVVGALEATAGLAGVPGAVVLGRLADRTGRRRAFVLASLAGTGVTLLVVPLAGSLGALLALNGVLWFAVAAGSPVATLFVLEGVPEREWDARIGLLNAYGRYGWVGGLVLGTVWLAGRPVEGTVAAQRALFGVCGVAALVGAAAAARWLPPESTVTGRRLARSAGAARRLVAGSGRYLRLVPYAPGRAAVLVRREGVLRRGVSPTMRRYLLTALVFSAGFGVFFAPAPAFLVALSYPPAVVFGFFVLASLGSAVAFVPAGRAAARRHPRWLQSRALGLRAALFPAVGLVGLLPAAVPRGTGLAVAFLLAGLTWAVIAVTGAGMVSRGVTRRHRGEVLGLYAALSGIGGGLGSLLGGAVAALAGYQAAFALAGGLVLASLGLLHTVGGEFGRLAVEAEGETVGDG
jgi:MFS family permease